MSFAGGLQAALLASFSAAGPHQLALRRAQSYSDTARQGELKSLMRPESSYLKVILLLLP